MSSVSEYKCPGCGAPIAFDAESGTVKCSHCGTEYQAEEVVMNQPGQRTDESFDWGNFKAGLSSEVLDNTVVYQCKSCGATLETTATTAATTCPYCDNNIVLTDRVGAGLRPNAVIPFAIDKKQLKGIVENFYKGKKLLPKNFFDLNRIEKILGVYIPFWFFDCDVDGTVNLKGQTVSRRETPKEVITTTRDYMCVRNGSMSFENVPVDASKTMDDDMMDSIEPYDYSKMVPFEEAYLTGFVADRFDSDPDAELPRANRRVYNSIVSALESTAANYAPVTKVSDNLKMSNTSVKYVLLPAYIINCQYNGQKYQYAVNGQTGKIVGQLPSDKKIATGIFLKTFGIAAAIVFVISMFLL